MFIQTLNLKIKRMFPKLHTVLKGTSLRDVIHKLRLKARCNDPFVSGAKVYFKENNERVERVISFLADDRSKFCYRQVIELRSTLKRKKDFIVDKVDDYYFDHSFFKFDPHGKGEVFIDCGAFTGDTIDSF